MLMQKNINKIIESNIEIQDKCSYWFNTDNKVLYRYNPTTEKWEPIDMSEAASQGILDEAIQVSVNTSNTYSDEKNNLLEQKLINYLNTKQKKISRTCRWARRGHIDEDNLNGVKYILVPCRMKCQYLMITNKYLKSLSESKKISQICGIEDIGEGPGSRQAFYKHIADMLANWGTNKPTAKTVLRKLSRWLAEENTIIANDNLDYGKLPIQYQNSQKVAKLYFATKMIITNKPKLRAISLDGGYYGENGKLIYNKDCDNSSRMMLCENFNTRGLNQFFYSKCSSNNIPFIGLEKTRLTKVPYMMFKNPFKDKVGGVIPVVDGKIRLDLARTLKNETLKLVSTGETLEFDREGICKNPLRKGRMEMFTGTKKYLRRTVGGHPYHTFSMSDEDMLKIKQKIEARGGSVRLLWYPYYNPDTYRTPSQNEYTDVSTPYNATLISSNNRRYISNNLRKFQYYVNKAYPVSPEAYRSIRQCMFNVSHSINEQLLNVPIIGYKTKNTNIWSIGYTGWGISCFQDHNTYISSTGGMNRYFNTTVPRRGIMGLHNMLYRGPDGSRREYLFGTFRRCNKTISQLLSMVGKNISLYLLSQLINNNKVGVQLFMPPNHNSAKAPDSHLPTTRAFFDVGYAKKDNRPLAFLLGYKDCFSKYQVNKYSKIYQGKYYPYIMLPPKGILEDRHNIYVTTREIKDINSYIFSGQIVKYLKLYPQHLRVKWKIDNIQYKYSISQYR